MRVTAVLPSGIVVSTDWLLIALLKHCIVIAVQKSCINASAVAVRVCGMVDSCVCGYCVIPPRHLHLRCFIT